MPLSCAAARLQARKGLPPFVEPTALAMESAVQRGAAFDTWRRDAVEVCF